MIDTLAAQAAFLMQDDAPVRRLAHAELLRAASFVAALPEKIRYHRFHHAMSPNMVHAYYHALDWNTVIVLAWTEGNEILGIVELHFYNASNGLEAEISLALGSAADQIGRSLMTCAIHEAAAAGARRSWMLVCPLDPAQFGIAQCLGARLNFALDTAIFTH